MTTRSERDKCKSQQEKHQALLSQLLKEEDNKYCVDCDAKGPRWASWNLGVFLCIRCAGIHRNLGVHISKVKSVNLDTWTQEQLGMVQEMGNSRARAVYEANLPDHFRRPQTDSTLEAFIRAKYEQKKYIAKEWVPPQPKFQHEESVSTERHSAVSEEKKEKKKARPRPSSAAASNIQLSGVSKPTSASSKAASAAAASSAPPLAKAAPPVKKKESNIDDLIGLESAVAPAPANNNDIFSDFMSAPAEPSATTPASGTGSEGLEASLFGGSSGGSSEPPKSTKDSIMALFGSGSQQAQQPQQQNFGVPGGMYINQQANQQQMAGMQMGAVPMQNGMNGMQNGMMPGANMMGVAPNMMAGANMMPGANVGMMGVPAGNNMMATQGMQPTSHQFNAQPSSNLMVVDPMAQLRTNIVNNMVHPGHMNHVQGQMMMGQMGSMPGMQQQPQQKGQMMGQMAPPAYNMATNMGAAQGVFNMQQQQPVAAAANQQFQQLANQMAGMSMGAQGMAGYQNAAPGIVAGGGGGAMWGAPQAGQTLSTNLWQ